MSEQSAPSTQFRINPDEWHGIVDEVRDLQMLSPEYFSNIRGYDEPTSQALFAKLQIDGIIAAKTERKDGLYIAQDPEAQPRASVPVRRRLGSIALIPVRAVGRNVSYKAEGAVDNFRLLTGTEKRAAAQKAAAAAAADRRSQNTVRRQLAVDSGNVVVDADAPDLQRGPTLAQRRLAEQAKRRERFSNVRGRGDDAESDEASTDNLEVSTADKDADDIGDRSWKAAVVHVAQNPEVSEQSLKSMLRSKFGLSELEAAPIAAEYHARFVTDGVLKPQQLRGSDVEVYERNPDVADVYGKYGLNPPKNTSRGTAKGQRPTPGPGTAAHKQQQQHADPNRPKPAAKTQPKTQASTAQRPAETGQRSLKTHNKPRGNETDRRQKLSPQEQYEKDVRKYEASLKRYEGQLELIADYEANPVYADLFETGKLKALHDEIQEEAQPLYKARIAELNKNLPADKQITSVEKMPPKEKRPIIDPIDVAHTEPYAGSRSSAELLQAITNARLKTVGKLPKPTPPKKPNA